MERLEPTRPINLKTRRSRKGSPPLSVDGHGGPPYRPRSLQGPRPGRQFRSIRSRTWRSIPACSRTALRRCSKRPAAGSLGQPRQLGGGLRASADRGRRYPFPSLCLAAPSQQRLVRCAGLGEREGISQVDGFASRAQPRVVLPRCQLLLRLQRDAGFVSQQTSNMYSY